MSKQTQFIQIVIGHKLIEKNITYFILNSYDIIMVMFYILKAS